jgi:hypothetical protein
MTMQDRNKKLSAFAVAGVTALVMVALRRR